MDSTYFNCNNPNFDHFVFEIRTMNIHHEWDRFRLAEALSQLDGSLLDALFKKYDMSRIKLASRLPQGCSQREICSEFIRQLWNAERLRPIEIADFLNQHNQHKGKASGLWEQPTMIPQQASQISSNNNSAEIHSTVNLWHRNIERIVDQFNPTMITISNFCDIIFNINKEYSVVLDREVKDLQAYVCTPSFILQHLLEKINGDKILCKDDIIQVFLNMDFMSNSPANTGRDIVSLYLK